MSVRTTFSSLFSVGRPARGSTLDREKAWARWCDAADRARASTAGLRRDLAGALRPEIRIAIGLIALNAVASFASAMLVKAFLAALLASAPSTSRLLALASGAVLTTIVAWIALNHLFYVVEVVGIGARSYVERRLFIAAGRRPAIATDETSLASVLDREGGRVEGAWSGGIMILLCAATLLVTSTFFFIALGAAAVVAIATIALSALVIARMASKMTRLFERVSLASRDRARLGTYAIKNRASIVLNGWLPTTVADYAERRGREETTLRAVARLVAAIHLVSSVAPIAALLLTALLQAWLVGHVDAAGLLAAIALIGGLRSVANNVPDAIQTIAQGAAAHRRLDDLFDRPGEDDDAEIALPSPSGRHVAIVGLPGSGRTAVLAAAARRSTCDATFFAGSEPWIFTGTLRENLRLRDVAHDPADVERALAYVRLDASILVDADGRERHLRADDWGISRGEAKRVELARGLLSGARDLYLDQPTMALDDGSAGGLLRDLLEGPWCDKRVCFVSDKPNEIALADEVWQVEAARVTSVRARTARRLRREDPVELRDRTARAPASSPAPAPSGDPPTFQDRLLRKVARFGLLNTWLLAVGVALLLRETLAIGGDYLLTYSDWSREVLRHALVIGIVTASAAVVSLTGALAGVRLVVRAATRSCVRFLEDTLSSPLGRTGSVEDLVARITRDQRRLDEVVPGLLLETIGAALLLASTTIYVAWTNPLLVVLIAPLLVYFYVMDRKALRSLGQASAAELRVASRFVQRVHELTDGARQLSVGARRDGVVAWLADLGYQRMSASLDNVGVQRRFGYAVDMVGVAAFSCVALGAALGTRLPVAATHTALAVSLSYGVISIFGRTSRTTVHLRQILDSADRLVTPRPPARATAGRQEPSSSPAVTFAAVSFGHGRHEGPIVDNLSVSFSAGDRVAVTGPSGSGKSTLAALMTGELSPTQGVVRVLGETPSLRRTSRAAQVQLFSANPLFRPGPLLAHFGLPPGADEVLLAAARRFDAEDVIRSLPGGTSYTVDLDGRVPLSKSQSQRLALIRSLTCATPVVILDEATSELPPDEEIAMGRVLARELPGSVLIFITHNGSLAEKSSVRIDLGTRRADPSAGCGPSLMASH